MPFKDYRVQTREIQWGTTQDTTLTTEQINIGCLLRIADATEKMAQRYDELINSRDYFKREVDRLRRENDRLGRSNASLRGHLKRAKKIKDSQ